MDYVCEPVTKYRHEFILAINSHLVDRQGKNVYQLAAFSLPLFSRQDAMDTFGKPNLVTSLDARC